MPDTGAREPPVAAKRSRRRVSPVVYVPALVLLGVTAVVGPRGAWEGQWVSIAADGAGPVEDRGDDPSSARTRPVGVDPIPPPVSRTTAPSEEPPTAPPQTPPPTEATRPPSRTQTAARPTTSAPRVSPSAPAPTETFGWVAVEGADFYRVQFFRGRALVLEGWPIEPRVTVSRAWVFRGRTVRLSPGSYRWVVRPAFGPRKTARYGPPVVESIWTYRG